MRKTSKTTEIKGRRMGLLSMMERLRREESGQSLVMVCVSMFVLLCVCALVVDLARGMDVQRQLQVSADAAALAAAENLPNTDFTTAGTNYTSNSGAKNAYNGLTITSSSVTGECLSTVVGWGIPCTSSSPNAVQVTQTTQIPMYFAQVLGIPKMNVSATSTASKGRPIPYNIALILDTTPSMNTVDSNCGGETQLQCALNGAQTLLQGLDPSMDYVSLFTFPNVPSADVADDYNCGSTAPSPDPGNSVGNDPYVFPVYNASSLSDMPYYTYSSKQVQTGTTGSGRHQQPVYTTEYTQNAATEETYQIVGFEGGTSDSSYKTSETATTLNTDSDLVKALGGGGSGCKYPIKTSWNDTYYAGAIYAAQSALVAEQESRSDGSQNVIIILSDGNATAQEQKPNTGDFTAVTDDMVTNDTADDGSTTNQDNMTSQYNGATNSGTYPSWVGQCGQGVDAANYASTYASDNQTLVITVAYGSPTTSKSASGGQPNNGNCESDVNAGKHPNITPCEALQDMASNFTSGNTEYFFSDHNQSGSDTGCIAPTSANNGTLNNIYGLISVTLSDARLIPNSTT